MTVINACRVASLAAVFLASACAVQDAPVTEIEPARTLSPLHAELDPVNGGRFVDGEGREVMLSGINLKSLGEYWHYDPEIAAVFPHDETDADRFADIGWNAVRLVITWSTVEPVPGEYDEAYLDSIEQAIHLSESRGIYTIIDLHQDAWGPTLAAREDENCPEGTTAAFGWDGAPGWATLHKDLPRCVPVHPLLGEREFSPAVMQAFLSFWKDEEGQGGVGIQTRFNSMMSHLAQRFSGFDAVLGYDVMNEPNAWRSELLALVNPDGETDDQEEYLSRFYQRALHAIRDGERKAGSPSRLMLFEPSPDWAQWPGAARPRFEHDGQVVYSPHIYQGGIVDQPLQEADFIRARAEAAEYGGVPILSGEWGTSPARAIDPEDDYFLRHQAYQDKYRVSATQWAWRTACGDPHLAHSPLTGVDLGIWGFFDVECPSNRTVGFRDWFADLVRRPLLRAAPGRIGSIHWDYKNARFSASGSNAAAGQELELFLHRAVDAGDFSLSGLKNAKLKQDIGPGQVWTATATAPDWSLQVGWEQGS